MQTTRLSAERRGPWYSTRTADKMCSTVPPGHPMILAPGERLQSFHRDVAGARISCILRHAPQSRQSKHTGRDMCRRCCFLASQNHRTSRPQRPRCIACGTLVWCDMRLGSRPGSLKEGPDRWRQGFRCAGDRFGRWLVGGRRSLYFGDVLGVDGSERSAG